MGQEDFYVYTHPEPLFESHVDFVDNQRLYRNGEPGTTMHAAPFFSVTHRVTFNSLLAEPERAVGDLSLRMFRLVYHMNSLDAGNTIPGTPLPVEPPILSFTTIRKAHYAWLPASGGWVQSTYPGRDVQGIGGTSSEFFHRLSTANIKRNPIMSFLHRMLTLFAKLLGSHDRYSGIGGRSGADYTGGG